MIPRVLISYSWDSEDHKDWVRALAERLRLNGIDARLDQWHVVPGQSLTQFMEVEISAADYVLIICTPIYYEKSLNRSGGVGYEQQIITGRIASGVPREKFIPILRLGSFTNEGDQSLPPHFLGTYAVDMRSDEDLGFEVLIRALFQQPSSPVPEIGNPPRWLTLADSASSQDVRLAAFDIEGWELESGVAQNHRHPETFEIPDEASRQNLVPGDIVKLAFRVNVGEVDEHTDDEGGFGERMWVNVTGSVGPYFTGTLSNQPITSDEQDVLRFGSPVVFLPEHVIDIQNNHNDL